MRLSWKAHSGGTGCASHDTSTGAVAAPTCVPSMNAGRGRAAIIGCLDCGRQRVDAGVGADHQRAVGSHREPFWHRLGGKAGVDGRPAVPTVVARPDQRRRAASSRIQRPVGRVDGDGDQTVQRRQRVPGGAGIGRSEDAAVAERRTRRRPEADRSPRRRPGAPAARCRPATPPRRRCSCRRPSPWLRRPSPRAHRRLLRPAPGRSRAREGASRPTPWSRLRSTPPPEPGNVATAAA